jgi:hypothetical protein
MLIEIHSRSRKIITKNRAAPQGSASVEIAEFHVV